MPKSFRLRQQQNRSNAPTSSTDVHVEVGVSEVELIRQLDQLKGQINALAEEFNKLKVEIQSKWS
jgi:uncharacterized protein (DUF342 family)